MPMGNTNIHIQINVPDFIMNLSLYVFCEFNCVAIWNKGHSIIKVRSSFQISQLVILVSYSRSPYVNENMSFPNSNFEGNFSTYVFRKTFRHYRELKIDCWTSRQKLCEKILNFFVCVEVTILVENWNIYEAHIFPRRLLKICRLETISLC